MGTTADIYDERGEELASCETQFRSLGGRQEFEGVIVNGAVRDSERLGGVELGVKALGTNPRRSHQHGTGTRGQAVIFGGVVFEHGGYVYADADGILVRRP